MNTQLLQKGYFGVYGGAFVPPVLEKNLEKLTDAFEKAQHDSLFLQELAYYHTFYTGRPSPLFYAERLSTYIGSKVYLKREDLNHTGSHKINNTLGQILLAKRMNAREIIAETGAGQHGVATATVAALMGMKCKIFMGAEDARRQAMNVERIKLLGAEVHLTEHGTATLKDAVDAALVYFCEHLESFYLLGSAVGPHPYPTMVGYFQSIIGREAREQILAVEKKLPDAVVACVGGGSNAIGLFSGFLDDTSVAIHAAEGGGADIASLKTAATLSVGKPHVFQGTYSYCLVNGDNEPIDAYSISAGLDYPGVGPEHAHLKDTGRVAYYPIMDDEAVEAFRLLSRLEGIIPAIESAHAVALAMELFHGKKETIIINLSGRGDKDVGRF